MRRRRYFFIRRRFTNSRFFLRLSWSQHHWLAIRSGWIIRKKGQKRIVVKLKRQIRHRISRFHNPQLRHKVFNRHFFLQKRIRALLRLVRSRRLKPNRLRWIRGSLVVLKKRYRRRRLYLRLFRRNKFFRKQFAKSQRVVRVLKRLLRNNYDHIQNVYFFRAIQWPRSFLLLRRHRINSFYARLFEHFSKKLATGVGYRHLRILKKFYSIRRGSLKRYFTELIRYVYIKKKLAREGKKFIEKKEDIEKRKKRARKRRRAKGLPLVSRTASFLFLRLFLHVLLERGLHGRAWVIFTRVITLLKLRYKDSYIKKFSKVIEKIRPLLKYRTMFVGGKKYRIPVILNQKKSYRFAVRWLVNGFQANRTTSVRIGYTDELFEIIVSALKNKSPLIKARNEYHRLAFENKSYIRFLRFLKRGW